MKPQWVLGAALAAGLMLGAVHAEELKTGDTLRVTTSNAVLRDAPKPFGAKALKTLGLGESVAFQAVAMGAYYEVKAGDLTGFLPQKSLVVAKKFSSYSKVSKVNSSDLAAATKGFSPEVEKKNREENTGLRYDLMDEAEAMSQVDDPATATQAFRKEGALGEFSEGGK